MTAGEGDGDDSGDDSGDEAERHGNKEEEEEEDGAANDVEDRGGPSPEPEIVVTSSQENLGPSEEEDSEFAKELAKMVVDTSIESRKVDRRTAQALWENVALPQNLKKKRAVGAVADEEGAEGDETDIILGSEGRGVMNFTVLTKKGNKQQARQLAIPSESALAVQTRSAQIQDKVEQQHLKRLVLDYEQREEVEELKGVCRLQFHYFMKWIFH